MTHAAVAVAANGDETAYRAALEDWRTAPIDERVRAMLGFLEKLTLRPAELSAADADVVRAAGVSDPAMEEAIAVAFVFNMIDRLADAFDFELPDQAGLRMACRVLLGVGYGRASVPG